MDLERKGGKVKHLVNLTSKKERCHVYVCLVVRGYNLCHHAALVLIWRRPESKSLRAEGHTYVSATRYNVTPYLVRSLRFATYVKFG